MDHRINRIGAMILAGLALTICMPGKSVAQSESISNSEHLSFVRYKHLADKSETTFDLEFETDSLLVKGRATTFINGYDSLHVLGFKVMPDQPNLIKVKGFVINSKTSQKLKWMTAVSYTTAPKDVTLINGSFIQFAAYNKLSNAEKGLAFFDAFDLDIVYVKGMYKLVLPYEKEVFTKAQKLYETYAIWRVDYKGVQIIQPGQKEVIASTSSSEETPKISTSLALD